MAADTVASVNAGPVGLAAAAVAWLASVAASVAGSSAVGIASSVGFACREGMVVRGRPCRPL